MKKRIFAVCLAMVCLGFTGITYQRNQQKNDTKQSQEIHEGENEFLIYTYTGDPPFINHFFYCNRVRSKKRGTKLSGCL